MKKLRVSESKIAGKGAFALEPIKRAELILKLSGARKSESEIDAMLKKKQLRWDDPFEIGNGTYIYLDALPVSINHSCNPNGGVRKINEVYALRDIKVGEEITYDYSTVVGANAEGEEDWVMPCCCGAENCRGAVGNWLSLSKKQLAFYRTRNALPTFVLAEVLKVQDFSKKTQVRGR